MAVFLALGNQQRDLCRVNFEVTTLKSFSYLAFPHLLAPEKAPKQPSFDGELMAGSRWSFALIKRANADIRRTDGCRDSFRIADYPGASGARLLSDLGPHRL
jgi:hypothetical protein